MMSGSGSEGARLKAADCVRRSLFASSERDSACLGIRSLEFCLFGGVRVWGSKGGGMRVRFRVYGA